LVGIAQQNEDGILLGWAGLGWAENRPISKSILLFV
jgi:hypothetical protein